MNIKELFEQAENGVLTYDQFAELAKNGNAKFVDLSEGAYVSKNKYDAELEAKAKEIETLTGTISTRDTDLDTLKKQLEDAGADASKLAELTTQFQTLQSKYDADSKAYKKQLAEQAYKYAVNRFADGQSFSSAAAKRDFVQSMIAKQLKMENDSILGADDFLKSYTETNGDAFISEIDLNEFAPSYDDNKPQFVGSTPGMEDANSNDATGGFLNAMHFTPLRPMPN